MLLTKHAQKLYRGIEVLGGGVTREQVLRTKADGISHGMFIAVCRTIKVPTGIVQSSPSHRWNFP